MQSTALGIRKNLYLPRKLDEQATQAAKESGKTLSQFVREALANHLAAIETEKLRRELVEECKAYYEIDREIAAEWRTTEPNI
jgi:predicted DNA-binding protein